MADVLVAVLAARVIDPVLVRVGPHAIARLRVDKQGVHLEVRICRGDRAGLHFREAVDALPTRWRSRNCGEDVRRTARFELPTFVTKALVYPRLRLVVFDARVRDLNLDVRITRGRAQNFHRRITVERQGAPGFRFVLLRIDTDVRERIGRRLSRISLRGLRCRRCRSRRGTRRTCGNRRRTRRCG